MKAERRINVINPSGLHARPLARLIKEVLSFECDVLISNLTTDVGPVDARSMISVLTLGVECGHEILITADGEDAEQACERLADLVTNELMDIDEQGQALT